MDSMVCWFDLKQKRKRTKQSEGETNLKCCRYDLE